MERDKKEIDTLEKNKMLSFFLIAFPTLLIIGILRISPKAWWVTIILAIYQFVLLKQFVDKYYEEMF